MMKKLVFFSVSVLLLSILTFVSGCNSTNVNTSPVTSPQQTSTVATITGSTVATKTNYGGNLRIISTGGPLNVGYAAKQAFVDSIDMIWSERIFELAPNGNLLPFLADSYEMSTDGKVITLHLKKDIKFHDGADWNAKACAWTYQTCLEAKTLPDSKYVESISAVDDYTVKITLNQRNSKMIYGLTRMFHYSPTAFEKNGEEWAINHAVSTSALQVMDFQRDVVVKMKKFDNYWQKGLPYLNEAELKTVKEPAACSALMQAGQADIWLSPPALEASDLKDKGYPTMSVPYYLNNIYPDSNNVDSPFANKKVREALGCTP